jgi:hypothetical protein
VSGLRVWFGGAWLGGAVDMAAKIPESPRNQMYCTHYRRWRPIRNYWKSANLVGSRVESCAFSRSS